MREAYVVAAERSTIGNFTGGLTNMPLIDLEAAVLNRTIEETGIDPVNIDEVIVRNAIAVGLGQNIGCQVSTKAGVPVEICTQSLNMLCSSGLKAVTEAIMRVQCGFGDIFIAGGVESITNALYLVPSRARSDVKMDDMKMMDSMLHDRLIDGVYGIYMGVTADNIAKKYSISCENQDVFAYVSQRKTITAIDSGRFQGEIMPVKVPGRKGSMTIFNTDEHPNRASTPEKLAELRPAFTKDGTVTAGSTSDINGGASFTIIASEDTVKKHNLTPLMEVIGIGQNGVDPRVMSLSPTPVILYTLKYTDLCTEDMELVELNEAFAAQSLGVIHELEGATDMDRNAFMEKANINGEAVTLGHPVGASGNRILVSLLHEIQKRDSKIGPAPLRVGGGQDAAVIIRHV